MNFSAKEREKVRAHHRNGFQNIAIAAISAAVILTVYLLRLDGVVGMFKDDGWYVILAKSLATGHGYNLINLPQSSGFSFYPPFFPLLLSGLYRLWPHFPANILLLKALSIASMLALPILVFRLFDREDRLPRSLAYLVAIATALSPSLIFFATSSVMSECVFTTLQFATLLYADRCRRDAYKQTNARTAIAAGVLAAASILTRTIGIALVPAIAVDFLRQKILRPLAIFLVTTILCLAPWQIYKHLRTNGNSAPVMSGYSAQFWDRLAGSYSGTKVTPRDLPARVWQISTVVIGDDIGVMLAPSLYRFPGESGQEVIAMTAVIPRVSRDAIGLPGATMGLNTSAQIISLGFSIVVFIGFVAAALRDTGVIELFFAFTLAMVVVWPWTPVRFLAPLVPFLFYYLLLGITTTYRVILKKLGGVLSPNPWAVSRVVMLCLVGLLLYDNASYVVAKREGISSLQYPDWVRQFEANKEAAEWMREHIPASDVVGGGNPSFIYLFSGRHTSICMPAQCVKMGIRFYLATGDEEVSVPATPVFRSNYHGISVMEFQPK